MDSNHPEGSTFFERLNARMQSSISVRLFFIAILSLILLIPAAMVEDLIRERSYRKSEVIHTINNGWGLSQTITGPILTIPYLEHTITKDDEVITLRHQAHFLPESLYVEGDLKTSVRNISLFESVVYNSQLDFSGNFTHPSFEEWKIATEDILWEEAYVSLGITDMRGIQDQLDIRWNDTEHTLSPGTDNRDLVASGVSTRVPMEADSSSGEHSFQLTIDLNGSELLHLYPLGKTTEFALSSAYPHPGFVGAFLPDEREISADGFTAHWKILSLNRNYPQQWKDDEHRILGSEFGVSLITPVDDYQKSTRSVKYALMMIAFTFLIFFFLEIRSGKKVHPIQFILVGLALIVFYTLLIALSEHIGFNPSYLISSVAVTALIAMYFQAIFKQFKMTAILMAVLALMYGFIFTTLQLQDYALLIGSIGLFLVLALVMYLSRKVDWYALSKGGESE
ncbi:MAG: cell envelope integrity protein CreD [Flavobacteriales bacterium]|nr:cell envelope integrity protein CreD [Flavobacteriales bacterium]